MSEIAAKTVFQTGPDTKVAAADVYKAAPTTPVNNGQTVVSQATAPAPTLPKISLKSVVTTAPTAVKDAVERVKNVTGGVAGITDDLKWAMEGGVGGAPDRLKFIVDKGKTALKGATADLTKNAMGTDVRMVIDGVEQIRKTGDFSSAQGVMNVLGQISGNPAFAKIDVIGDKLGVLSSITNKIAALRIPQLIDTVLTKLQNDKEKKQYLLDNLMNFVTASDLYSVKLTIDNAGSVAVLAKMPDIVLKILMYYRLPAGTDSPTTAAATELNNLLNRLDPNWTKYRRDGVLVSNLEPFASSNPIALDTLKLLPQYMVQAIICKTYLTRDLVDLARQYYPLAAFARR